MTNLIDQIPTYLSLLANIVIIAGAIPVFLWLKNLSYQRKKKEIDDNLSIRADIEDGLREHADGYDRRVPHDIGIRLVYWKNYPWRLENDGYKQNLYYDTNLDKRIDHGTEFLNNIGILVEEHMWFLSKALYLGRYGIYIIERSGQTIEGFREVKQRVKLVRTLKYKYIVNWDFKEKIEYEPVFYTKYKYYKKKLYDNDFFAQNVDDDGIANDLYFHEYLNKNNRVKSIRSIKYYYLLVKGNILKNIEIYKMKQPVKKANRKRKRKL